MGNSLDELSSYFLPQAKQLLAKCEAEGVPCRVVDTGRTTTEQTQKLAQGVSWTAHSKHEPQPPEGLSEAIDIVPIAILVLHKPDWDIKNPLWQKIGTIGKNLGLIWGGDWKHVNRGNGDPSHFQYNHNQPPQILTDVELSTT